MAESSSDFLFAGGFTGLTVRSMQRTGRKVLQSSCSIDSCQTTYGTCRTYAGAGCTTGNDCTYTSCSILSNGKKDCTWRCATVSIMVRCDPTLYCRSCTATRGSSCPSGSCTWSSCSIDYAVGIPVCSHVCTPTTVCPRICLSDLCTVHKARLQDHWYLKKLSHHAYSDTDCPADMKKLSRPLLTHSCVCEVTAYGQDDGERRRFAQ